MVTKLRLQKIQILLICWTTISFSWRATSMEFMFMFCCDTIVGGTAWYCLSCGFHTRAGNLHVQYGSVSCLWALPISSWWTLASSVSQLLVNLGGWTPARFAAAAAPPYPLLSILFQQTCNVDQTIGRFPLGQSNVPLAPDRSLPPLAPGTCFWSRKRLGVPKMVEYCQAHTRSA